MLPMIGVCPLFDARSSRIWMRSEYLQAVEEAGGVPVVLPLTGTGTWARNFESR